MRWIHSLMTPGNPFQVRAGIVAAVLATVAYHSKPVEIPREAVLALTQDVPLAEPIQESMLTMVEVPLVPHDESAPNPGGHVRWANRETVIGKVAIAPLRADTLLVPWMFSDRPVPDAGTYFESFQGIGCPVGLGPGSRAWLADGTWNLDHDLVVVACDAETGDATLQLSWSDHLAIAKARATSERRPEYKLLEVPPSGSGPDTSP